MSYTDDVIKANTLAIRDLLNSGLIEEIRLANLLNEAQLGLINPQEISTSSIYKTAYAKRRKLSKNNR